MILHRTKMFKHSNSIEKKSDCFLKFFIVLYPENKEYYANDGKFHRNLIIFIYKVCYQTNY